MKWWVQGWGWRAPLRGRRARNNSFKKRGRIEKGREMVAISRGRRTAFLFSFNEIRQVEVLREKEMC